MLWEEIFDGNQNNSIKSNSEIKNKIIEGCQNYKSNFIEFPETQKKEEKSENFRGASIQNIQNNINKINENIIIDNENELNQNFIFELPINNIKKKAIKKAKNKITSEEEPDFTTKDSKDSFNEYNINKNNEEKMLPIFPKFSIPIESIKKEKIN